MKKLRNISGGGGGFPGRSLFLASGSIGQAVALAAMFVIAVMLVGLLTGTAQAVEPNSDESASISHQLSKTATNLNEDFESTVTLAVEDDAEVQDVVFVIDATSSDFAERFLTNEHFEPEVSSLFERLIYQVGENRLNVGVVVYGSAPTPRSGILQTSTLELTPLNEDTQQTIYDALSMDSITPQNAGHNMERAFVEATRMLDKSSTDPSNQAIVLITNGRTSAWGYDEQDTSYTIYSEPEEASFDEELVSDNQNAVSAQPEAYRQAMSNPVEWLEEYGYELEEASTGALVEEFQGQIILRDESSSQQFSYVAKDEWQDANVLTPTGSDVALYRAASTMQQIMSGGWCENPAADQRSYIFVADHSHDAESDGGSYLPAISPAVSDFASGLHTLDGGSVKTAVTKEIDAADTSDDYVQQGKEAVDYLANAIIGSASPLSGLVIQDVIGGGSDDGFGNEYDFQFVNDASELELTVNGVSLQGVRIEDGSNENLYLYGFNPVDFGEDGTRYSFYLYYLPQGLAAFLNQGFGSGALTEEQIEELWNWPIGGSSMEECIFLVRAFDAGLPAPSEGVESIQLSYKVKLLDPQDEPGQYGAYDEDGSEEFETLLTNKSAATAHLDTIANGMYYWDPFLSGQIPEYGSWIDSTLAFFPRPTVSYTVMGEGTVSVTPADIEVYMGGSEGNAGAVNEDGTIVGANSLPTFGFTFVLPDSLEAALAADEADITDVAFSGADGRTWAVVPYPGSEEAARKVYSIVPTYENPDPVRVEFTASDGHTIISDEFEVGREVNTTFDMMLYTGNAGQIVATYNGVPYGIELRSGALTVRGTTDAAQYGNINDEGDPSETAPDEPAVRADAGTVFTINGSEVEVVDPSGVSLLFDDIIDSSDDGAGDLGRVEALENRSSAWEGEAAENSLPGSVEAGTRCYEFKYLDLVDANNGNAWVAAQDGEGNGRDVTVYWPLPEGTDSSTDFVLLHYQGLHRDMTSGAVADLISACDVEEVQIVDVTDTHVVFSVGSGGFSPFALVWSTGDETPIGQTEGDEEPQGGNLSILPGTGDNAPVLAGGLAVAGVALIVGAWVTCHRGE